MALLASSEGEHITFVMTFIRPLLILAFARLRNAFSDIFTEKTQVSVINLE